MTKHKYLILGGDLRNIRLAQMLADDDNKVFEYGLEDSEEIVEDGRIERCKALNSAIEKAQIIIGPIPFSNNDITINTPFSTEKILIEDLTKINKTKIFIAGNIPKETERKLRESYLDVLDVMKREELTILNTIATAEGAINVAITNTDKILQGSKVLILGFGRIAKIIANKFEKLSADVTCSARKISDLAWIQAYGYKSIDINEIIYYLKNFDIIINTVPQTILKERELKHVDPNVLLIDLASIPGGIDSKVAVSMGLKFVWALALPGKIAPTSSAEFIKDTIYNMLDERSKNVD